MIVRDSNPATAPRKVQQAGALFTAPFRPFNLIISSGEVLLFPTSKCVRKISNNTFDKGLSNIFCIYKYEMRAVSCVML